MRSGGFMLVHPTGATPHLGGGKSVWGLSVRRVTWWVGSSDRGGEKDKDDVPDLGTVKATPCDLQVSASTY